MTLPLYIVDLKSDVSAAAAHAADVMLLPGPGHPETSARRRDDLPETSKSPLRE